MEDFDINSQIVKVGENKQIVLNSYELHTKTKIEIPVFVFRSNNPGPTARWIQSVTAIEVRRGLEPQAARQIFSMLVPPGAPIGSPQVIA